LSKNLFSDTGKTCVMEKEWIAAYAYLAYLFLATLPELTNTPGV